VDNIKEHILVKDSTEALRAIKDILNKKNEIFISNSPQK
jgi:hypothetical protein